MKVRRLIVMFAIIFAVVPVIISTVVCEKEFYNITVSLIKENVANVTKVQSDNLNNFFEQRKTDLKFISDIPMTKNFLNNSKNSELKEEVIEMLRSRAVQEDFLQRISIIDDKGTVLASSDIEAVGKATLLKKDMEHLPRGEVRFTQVLSLEAYKNGANHFVAVMPIYEGERYLGSVFQAIGMSYFENELTENNFFQNGKIIVMDNCGVIAADDNEHIVKTEDEGNLETGLFELWGKIDFAKNPNEMIDCEIDGRHKIGYYSTIQNTGWTVFSIVDRGMLIKPIYTVTLNIIFFTIGVFILILFFSCILGRYISTPIKLIIDTIHKIEDGDNSARVEYHGSNELAEIAAAFNELMENIEKNGEKIRQGHLDLDMLTSNIPGGAIRCDADKRCFFTFTSEGFLKLLGYSREELEVLFGNRFINTVYEEDRVYVAKILQAPLSLTSGFEIEYRAVCADGKLIWILNKGKIVEDEDGQYWLYCVIIDITERKQAQEELSRNEERHRIVINQTEDIVFEWDIANDTVYHSDNWKKKFGYDSIHNNFLQSILKKDFVNIEDREMLVNELQNIVNDSSYREIEFRIRHVSGSFIWCKARVSGIKENGKTGRLIGVLIDIDKEKRKTALLLAKTQVDTLTKLYNKGTTEQLIVECIKNSGENSRHALMVVDIDNFKHVNDTFGHMTGDSVLIEISDSLKNQFRATDILGRVGGDEFIIFVKDIGSMEILNTRAKNILEMFGRTFSSEEHVENCSASIGAAIYPDHGRSYETLFRKADMALYKSKDEGKNRFSLYKESKKLEKI